MLSDAVRDGIYDQINLEFQSAYSYLAMSAYCEWKNFSGCAIWLRVQSQEEHVHALRLYDFLLARDCPMALKKIEQPKCQYESIPDVFETALQQEMDVTKAIDELYVLALKEGANAAMVELQWFVSEQVEEEKTARTICAQFNMIKDDASAMLEMDRVLGARQAEGQDG
jgi:ferritin